MLLIVGVVVIFIVVGTLALCKAAGDADRQSERLITERKQRENHKLCSEVSCSKCDQNDWCGFSELKNLKEAI